jgi:acyl carrier protein
MRLRNWVACWVASYLLIAGCDVQTGDTQSASTTKESRSDDSVEAKVVGIIAELNKIRPARIQRQSRFVKDLGLDSLDIVELVMEAEEKFNISIADSDAEKLETVGQLVEYIRSRRAKSD